MRRAIAAALALVVLLAARFAGAAEIPAIAYHDIVSAKNGDPYAITVKDFERQMAYLHTAGYRPISLRVLEEVRRGKAALPAKPVLLTFDDGYRSYYERAYPVLARYGFPSVVSIVTSWVDRRAAPEYTAAPLMTWDEVREIARSPLVEVLSHTDDLHDQAPAGPAGVRRPAGVTRIYDAAAGGYETDAAHAQRAQADLARSAERIEAELGKRPVGVTWPYGEYEHALIEAASAQGMHYHLTLDAEPTRLEDLPRVNRATFRDYRTLADFGDMLAFRQYRRQQLRFVEFDLGPLAAHDAAGRARLIAAMARRAEVLRADAVLLRPFTPDGARAYFHNGAVPAAAELLSQVGHQLENRAGLLHLYLSIPAGADFRAYADLARLHWFTGVALEGAPDRAAFERASAVLRRYKPALKLGIRGREPVAGVTPDFVLVDVAADTPPKELARDVQRALAGAPRPLFLLARAPALSDAALRDAMALLRSAGAAHYGYGPDDYVNGAPAPLAIVRALTEHTIVGKGR